MSLLEKLPSRGPIVQQECSLCDPNAVPKMGIFPDLEFYPFIGFSRPPQNPFHAYIAIKF
jgi:hypothetical protein